MRWDGHVFLSYDNRDGSWLAELLRNELDRGHPQIGSSADLTTIDPDDALDEIGTAIDRCACFLLLATPMTFRGDTPTKQEWKLAFDYKKPIIVVHADEKAPVGRLARRPRVRVGPDRTVPTEALRLLIIGTATSEGELQAAQSYLEDAREALARARGTHHEPRFLVATTEWEQRVEELSEFLSDPGRARERLDRRVEAGLELLRKRPSSETTVQSRVVGRFPVPLQSLFQDRETETKALCDFFRAPSGRIALVSGRGGVGKSATVCRVLDGIIRGSLPDDHGSFSASAVILLSFKTGRLPTADGLRNGLIETAAAGDRVRLGNLLGAQGVWSAARLAEVLDIFSIQHYSKPIIILMDNMEDGIETSTLDFIDQDLGRFLSVLALTEGSAIKVVMTSRLCPKSLQRLNPAVLVDLPFHEGLPTPFAENLLRAFDVTGAYGLRDGSEQKLTALRYHTRGFPRALDAVWMQLQAGSTVDEILSRELADDFVVEALVGEALRRLTDIDQLIICTLAVFARPVPSTAIEFVLRTWFDHIDAATALARLVNMRFVHRQKQSYALHPVDAANAILVLRSRDWPTGRRTSNGVSPTGEPEPLTVKAMKTSAANYFKSVERPRSEWKTINDVDEYVAQFRIRIEVGDEFSAAFILDRIKDFADKQGCFRLILELAEQLEKLSISSYPKCVALKSGATALWRGGRRKDAASRQKQLISLLENDRQDTSIELANLAIYEFGTGRYREALVTFQRVCDTHSANGPPDKNMEVALNWLSSCHSALGHLDKALELQKRALEIAERLRDTNGIEAQTHNLASIYQDLGNTPMAKKLALDALNLAEATGNPLWKANHLSLLATISHTIGDKLSAKRYLDEGVVIRKEIGDIEGLANAMLVEGEWQLCRGESAAATGLAFQALAQEASDERVIQQAKALLAGAALERKEWLEAKHLLDDIIELATDGPMFRYRAMLGCCLLGLREDERARLAFENAAADAREWIARCDANAEAHSGLGWALAGLYTLGHLTQADAVSAFCRARELRGHPGDLKKRMHEVGLLAYAKPDVVLGPVLAAIDGVIRASVTNAGEIEMEFERGGLGGEAEGAHTQREQLVRLLAKRASSSAAWGEFLNNLLLSARLSDRWRFQLQGLIRGDPESASRALVRSVLDFGGNPSDGNAALATLLLPLLPVLGVQDAVTVGSILLSYDLVRSPRDREEVAARYQFPRSLDRSFARSVDDDPVFATDPPSDEIILQGWLTREPDFLDLALLRMAVQRARSVCRVELPALRTSGTGILIGDDLILTNYHVLAPGGSSPDANASDSIMRFGAFSDGGKASEDGQVLRLHKNAVVARSSTDKLDFVLLRTAEPAVNLTDIVPLDVGGDAPRIGDDVHILQHPEGGAMKLALSNNSVVSVNESNGRIQYATRTLGGSSGSPCFNAEWELIALHHAELARPFGSVREGILMGAILDEIRTHLS